MEEELVEEVGELVEEVEELVEEVGELVEEVGEAHIFHPDKFGLVLYSHH